MGYYPENSPGYGLQITLELAVDYLYTAVLQTGLYRTSDLDDWL